MSATFYSSSKEKKNSSNIKGCITIPTERSSNKHSQQLQLCMQLTLCARGSECMLCRQHLKTSNRFDCEVSRTRFPKKLADETRRRRSSSCNPPAAALTQIEHVRPRLERLPHLSHAFLGTPPALYRHSGSLVEDPAPPARASIPSSAAAFAELDRPMPRRAAAWPR